MLTNTIIILLSFILSPLISHTHDNNFTIWVLFKEFYDGFVKTIFGISHI